MLSGVSVLTALVAVELATHHHQPPVGVYIALGGIAAAFMAARGEGAGNSEKAWWIVFITVLVVAEITNLYRADRDQVKSFQSITSGLQSANSGLQSTADQLRSVVSLERDNIAETKAGLSDAINTMTGGNSFCYLDIFPVSPEKNAVNHAAAMGVVRVGKYPLHGITM